jgi:hypothetical protein
MKKRHPFILTGLVMLLIGFSIQISNAPRGAKYIGTFFCVAGSYASFPGVVAWSVNSGSVYLYSCVFSGWATTSLVNTSVELVWQSISE